ISIFDMGPINIEIERSKKYLLEFIHTIMHTIKKLYLLGLSVLLFTGWSCSDSFLDQSPQGQLSDDQINNTKGVEWLLIGAYGLMNGNTDGTWGNYSSGPSS